MQLSLALLAVQCDVIEQVEHDFAVGQVLSVLAFKQFEENLLGCVLLFVHQRLAVDLGAQQSGLVFLDVAHDERRVDEGQGAFGLVGEDLHGGFGSVECVVRLRLALRGGALAGAGCQQDGQGGY